MMSFWHVANRLDLRFNHTARLPKSYSGNNCSGGRTSTCDLSFSGNPIHCVKPWKTYSHSTNDLSSICWMKFLYFNIRFDLYSLPPLLYVCVTVILENWVCERILSISYITARFLYIYIYRNVRIALNSKAIRNIENKLLHIMRWNPFCSWLDMEVSIMFK